MTTKFRILLRLTAPPVLAVAIVVFLAALSLFDLSRIKSRNRDEGEKSVPTPSSPESKGRVPLTKDVPNLSEEEALKILKGEPTRGAVARLWPLQVHHDALFGLLLNRETAEEIRLHLLGAFEVTDKGKALKAARSIAAQKDLGEGSLLMSALEVLSRHGEEADFALLAERPGETYQLKALREEYRDSIERRTH